MKQPKINQNEVTKLRLHLVKLRQGLKIRLEKGHLQHECAMDFLLVCFLNLVVWDLIFWAFYHVSYSNMCFLVVLHQVPCSFVFYLQFGCKSLVHRICLLSLSVVSFPVFWASFDIWRTLHIVIFGYFIHQSNVSYPRISNITLYLVF